MSVLFSDKLQGTFETMINFDLLFVKAITDRYFVIMRPSSLGGGRILRRTLSVCLSVCPSVCPSVPLSLPSVTSFHQPLALRMHFSARTEGRISYGHLGRTDSCLLSIEC